MRFSLQGLSSGLRDRNVIRYSLPTSNSQSPAAEPLLDVSNSVKSANVKPSVPFVRPVSKAISLGDSSDATPIPQCGAPLPTVPGISCQTEVILIAVAASVLFIFVTILSLLCYGRCCCRDKRRKRNSKEAARKSVSTDPSSARSSASFGNTASDLEKGLRKDKEIDPWDDGDDAAKTAFTIDEVEIMRAPERSERLTVHLSTDVFVDGIFGGKCPIHGLGVLDSPSSPGLYARRQLYVKKLMFCEHCEEERMRGAEMGWIERPEERGPGPTSWPLSWTVRDV